MYKAVFFDLDGTLLDTLPDICAVLNSTLARFSLAPVTPAQTTEFVGNGAYMLVKRAAGDIDEGLLNEVYKYYSSAFAACQNDLSQMYEGEEQVLSSLSSLGVKFAIVTNKPQRATINVYNKFFSRYNFFMVQGQEEGVPLKPSPAALLKGVELSGCKLNECLFVGDGETDVLTAANAGMDGVSVLWGYRTKGQLMAVGAKRFVSDYMQLKDLILGEKL